MVATVGSIQVAFNAEMTAYAAALARGVRNTESATGKMSKSVQALEARFSRLGGIASTFGKGLLAGVAAGGVAGLSSTLSDMARSLAAIGDEAKRAGLSTKTFQELGFVARQNRIGVDALVDGIKELNLRADEWITTGAGPAAEAFQRLGYTAAELKEKLRDPSALFTEIIGKLQKLDRAAQIRVLDEVFGGTGGEKFAQLIEQGEAGIRKTIKAAHDLDIVIDDELIKRAEELDRKFQAITETVGTGLKRAVVEAAGALQTFIDRFRQIDARQTETLRSQLAEAERNLKAAQAAEGRLGGILDGAVRKQIEHSQAEVDRLRQVLRDRTLETIRPQLEANRRAAEEGAAPKQDRLGYTPPPSPAAPRVDGSIDRAVNSFDRLSDAVSRFVDNVVQAESGGNSAAKNPNSSATGLGQFIESTWLAMFRREFPDRAASMSRETILALRTDAEISRQLIEAYARENAGILRQAGVSVNEAALQLSHFLGPQGAISVLTARAGTKVSDVLDAQVINANPTILGGGATVEDVIAYAERRAGANQDVAASLDEVTTASGRADTATDQLTESYGALGSIGQMALDGITNALADGKLEGRELLQIMVDIAKQLLTMSVPSFGLGGGNRGLSAGSGGLLGGMIIPGILHKGGTAGVDGYNHSRAMPAAAFANAPRFHSGLKSNEIAAVLEKNERVLTEETNSRAVNALAVSTARLKERPASQEVAVRGVFVDDNGVIKARIERTSAAVTQQGITKFNDQLPGRIRDIMDRNF